jgi:hypothetical protein
VPYRFGRGGQGLLSQRTSVAMGPCFRRDDERGFDCQTTDATSRPATRSARAVHLSFAPLRAWGMPGARCTHSPACEVGSAHGSSPQVHRDHPAFPHAMVLTASFVLSPVTGLVCHRRQRIKVLSAPGRADKTSANLTPASGRQDHTTSPSAAIVSRQRAVDRSQIPKNPPCHHVARPTLPRPPHPIPTFVTMANAPLVGRDGGINKSVSTKWRSRIFLQRGLDTGVNKLPVGQITRPSRSTRGAAIPGL